MWIKNSTFLTVVAAFALTVNHNADAFFNFGCGDYCDDFTQYSVDQIDQTNLEDLVEDLTQRVVGIRRTPEQQVAAAAYIKLKLQSYGYWTVEMQDVKRVDGTVLCQNVITRRHGISGSNDIIVFGAHYDTVGTTVGADDNGSGTAGVLEVARVIAKSRPTTTIEFVLFCAEEGGAEGGIAGGSKQYVENLDDSTNVVAMFNLEMIGYTCGSCQQTLEERVGQTVPFLRDPPNPNIQNGCIYLEAADVTEEGDHIRAIANAQSESLADSYIANSMIYAPELEALKGLVADDGKCAADTRRSDHVGFWDKEIPAFFVTDTGDFRNPNYHTDMDTADSLNYVFMAHVTKGSIATLLEVAGPACGSYDFGCIFRLWW